MTTGRRDGQGTPFGHWLRAHPDLDARSNDLSATDCDMWVHKYLARDENHRAIRRAVDHVMLTEVKAFYADLPYAQRDTLTVIDALLRRASVQNGRRYPIRIPDHRHGVCNATRQVRWLGVHVLQMSADRPDNSNEMIWDGRYAIDEATLIKIIRFELDPDSPTRKLDTRRHHLLPLCEQTDMGWFPVQ